jgi:hypothetical protein
MMSDLEEEVFRLAASVAHGGPTDLEVSRLSELLDQSAEARKAWFEFQDLELGLTEWVSGRPSIPALTSPIAPPPAPNFVWPTFSNFTLGSLFLAFTGLTVLATLWLTMRSESSNDRSLAASEAPLPAIATLLMADECRWRDEVKRQEGARLLPGPLAIGSGTAVLRFDGGAELVMHGETDIELQTPGKARLGRGNVVVRAPEIAQGFVLLTPASHMVDLGTEFSVSVDERGATELQVLEGEVAWTKPSGDGAEQVVSEGRAIRFDSPTAKEPRYVALTSQRFSAFVDRSRDRPRLDLLEAYEGFDYREGVQPLSDSFAGIGWDGPWRMRTPQERVTHPTDSSDHLKIVMRKMNVSWPIPGALRGMWEMDEGVTIRVRKLARPIDMTEEGITYFSLLVREPEQSEATGQRPLEGVRLSFRSSEGFNRERLSFGVNEYFFPTIQTGLGVGFSAAKRAVNNQTTFWVGKIIRRTGGEDELSFQIYGEDENLPLFEPPSWLVSTRGAKMDNRFDLVFLSSTGHASRIVDELRIGKTWRSVVVLDEEYRKQRQDETALQ